MRGPRAELAEAAPARSTEVSPKNGESEFAESAVIVECEASVPRAWAEGFANLDAAIPPPGFTARQWAQVVDDARRLLNNGAMLQKAIQLGWRAEDLFGVHPVAPEARFDAMGLVSLIHGGEVIDIKADRATIRSPNGNCLTYYLRRESTEAVPLWDLRSASTGSLT